MGKVYDSIDERLRNWIERQQIFFVGTAPLSGDGRVNVSPKGLDTFRILDGHTVAYLDLTGSGAETIAHIKENRRITVMFSAFDGPARIVRLYGAGEVIEPTHPEFERLAALFPEYPGVRSVIRIDVSRIADSCGFGVPNYEYQGQRSRLPQWAEAKTPDELLAYQIEKNTASIDALPALSLDENP